MDTIINKLPAGRDAVYAAYCCDNAGDDGSVVRVHSNGERRKGLLPVGVIRSGLRRGWQDQIYDFSLR